jgi:hypothetical protein
MQCGHARKYYGQILFWPSREKWGCLLCERREGEGQRESEGLAKFKGLAKEFRREASRWKKLDTSIAKARQDAFNECASDIEAAVKALEHGPESEQPEHSQ